MAETTSTFRLIVQKQMMHEHFEEASAALLEDAPNNDTFHQLCSLYLGKACHTISGSRKKYGGTDELKQLSIGTGILEIITPEMHARGKREAAYYLLRFIRIKRNSPFRTKVITVARQLLTESSKDLKKATDLASVEGMIAYLDVERSVLPNVFVPALGRLSRAYGVLSKSKSRFQEQRILELYVAVAPPMQHKKLQERLTLLRKRKDT